VHQDIKPENCMTGIGSREHHIYLIDLGLGACYWQRQHVPLKQTHALTGTLRYSSINAHKGFRQSRRDDLEAAGHMFLYMLRGKLPWSGLQAKTKREKYQKILEVKESYPLNRLVEGHAEVFEQYLSYARKLGYTQRPDYDLLFSYLEASPSGQEDVAANASFPWLTCPVDPRASWAPEPLQPRVPLRQPDDPESPPRLRHRLLLRRFGCGCGSAMQAAMPAM